MVWIWGPSGFVKIFHAYAQSLSHISHSIDVICGVQSPVELLHECGARDLGFDWNFRPVVFFLVAIIGHKMPPTNYVSTIFQFTMIIGELAKIG